MKCINSFVGTNKGRDSVRVGITSSLTTYLYIILATMIIASFLQLFTSYWQSCGTMTSTKIKPYHSNTAIHHKYNPNHPSNINKSNPIKININLFPGTDQLLPLRGCNPHIRVLQSSVTHETSTQSTSKGKNDHHGVGTNIRKPNVVFELIPVFGNVLVKVCA